MWMLTLDPQYMESQKWVNVKKGIINKRITVHVLIFSSPYAVTQKEMKNKSVGIVVDRQPESTI